MVTPSRAARRSDARRNEATLIEAACAVFARAGVEAPLREIASEAGVGTATIYRHFPTRADLILAVYRQQVEDLAAFGAVLSEEPGSGHTALMKWIDRFVRFVETKQGLATTLQSNDPCYDPLHAYFVERLEPVCRDLLDAAAEAGDIEPGQDPYELMLAVGGLCAAAGRAPGYDTRRLARLLVAGLRKV